MTFARTERAPQPGERLFDGRKLYHLRNARGWTRPEFSAKTEIPISMLVEYERSRSLPSVPRLFAIADALGCSVEDLTSIAA